MNIGRTHQKIIALWSINGEHEALGSMRLIVVDGSAGPFLSLLVLMAAG